MVGFIVKVLNMQITNDIIGIVKDWSSGFKFVAPFQENPADFNAGYATVFQINSKPQTSVGETVTKDSILLKQLNALDFRFSFYKFVDYKENSIMPYEAATTLRNTLSSYTAMKLFNNKGLDIGPQMSELIVDTYRDNERNKYVQHAHFEVVFYKMDVTAIESGIFERVEINNSLVIDGGD